MGVPSWMVRRFPRGGRGCDDDVKLDPKKGFADNLREVLNNVCKRQGISEDKRISYLNSFIRHINPDNREIGLSRDDFFLCLRPLLIHESVRIRATALNLVRHFLRTKQDLASCIKLQYPFLIARSVDLLVQSESERVQAVRVARRMLCVDAKAFPVALARALVAIATSTIDEKDRLLRAALATLVELCLLNAAIFISVGGVTALVRNLSGASSQQALPPRMCESLLGALLFLLNKPDTRAQANIDLQCLATAYTVKGGGGGGGAGKGGGKMGEESRLQGAHTVLLSLLRSWPGLLHFCHTDKQGLRSLVATLHLSQPEVRRGVLDLLGELLCLPSAASAEWSDEPSVALDAADPSRFQDAFRIAEGFVAAEGRAVLPHVAKARVNLHEVHLALLLYSLLEVGLLDAIVEVIVSDDSFLSVRATILLGEVLHLVHQLLPSECCPTAAVCLPSLLSYAVRGRAPSTNGATARNSSAHYQRFRRDVLMRNNSNAAAVGGGGKMEVVGEGVGGAKPPPHPTPRRERRRTISSLSCRSRTVSDSSGDRSRMDRDSISAQADPASNDSYGCADTKTTSSKTTSILRDIQDVLKEISDDNINTVSEKLFVATKEEEDYIEADEEEEEEEEDENGKREKESDEFGAHRLLLDLDESETEDERTRFILSDPPFSIRVQQRALTAITTLSRLHKLLRKRPAPATIFLDHLVTSVDKKQTPSCADLARAKGRALSKSKMAAALSRECEEAIKDSGVLVVKDPFSWNWDTIRAILKGKAELFYDSNHRLFLKKLVQFFTPGSRQLMRVDVGGDRRAANLYTLTALELLDCLILSPKESECEKMLLDLLGSVSSEVALISSSPHSCLLSPQNVTSTLCSDYFLYAGHLSRTEAGRNFLERTGLFSNLLELIGATNLDCYVKLIVSTLDYTTEQGCARRIMNVALTSPIVAFRLYATKLLHVLLRVPLQGNATMVAWLMQALVERAARDTDRAVRIAAMEALDEAGDCEECVRALVRLRPQGLEALGDAGLLLATRLVSLPEGFTRLLEEGHVQRQLELWTTSYNCRYVCVVEARLCDALTLHERSDDGTYCGRVSGLRRTPSDVFVPPHLYGQLARHEAGFRLLVADGNLEKLVKTVHSACDCTDDDAAILATKAALWALGHVIGGGGEEGSRWAQFNQVCARMLRTATCAPVYSVRATAFYALCLVAGTRQGAGMLAQQGWYATRRNRHQWWPVIENEASGCGGAAAMDAYGVDAADDNEEQEVSMDSWSMGDYSSSSGGGVAGLERGEQIGRSFYLPRERDTTAEAAAAAGGERDRKLSMTSLLGGGGSGGRGMREVRAATLPHYASGGAGGGGRGGAMHSVQHNRSYSESKADESTSGSDRLNSPHRQQCSAESIDSRVNLSMEGLKKNRPSSCDISSGSSTDSVHYGKYNVTTDRVQTLSPIPSSGSLSTLKCSGVANQTPSRRPSVTNSISSHKSSQLSQQDAAGYAALRYLQRGRRPLPPSSLSTGTNPLSPLTSPTEHMLALPFPHHSHLTELAHAHGAAALFSRPPEFDGHGVTCRRLLTDMEAAAAAAAGSGGGGALKLQQLGKSVVTMPYQSSRSCIARQSDLSGVESVSSGPCFVGICLPQRLSDLFPTNAGHPSQHKSIVATRDTDTVLQDAGGVETAAAITATSSAADSETDTGTDSGGGGGGGGLGLAGGGDGFGYQARSTGKEVKAAGGGGEGGSKRRHDRNNCLLCTSNRAANHSRVQRLRKISSSSTHRTRTETESSYGAANEGESPIMLPWQTRGGLEGVNSVDSSSTDATSIVHRSPMDNMRSRSMVRRDILKLTSQLANPVLYKTCKQALLQLKQLYNDLFQDICVYSDVCSIIANSPHRIQARRFIQELFLDIPFTELYEDAVTLLSGGENGFDDLDQIMQMSGGGCGEQFYQQTADELNSLNSSDTAGNSNNFRAAKTGVKAFPAFESEPRSNPLLEVIPEHDARSDSSDACRDSSISRSMLNLSDFSAPNSFDANDGVLSAASFERRNAAIQSSATKFTTSLMSEDLHTDDSSSSPPGRQSLTSRPLLYQTSHLASTSLPASNLSSRATTSSILRSTSRELSKEKLEEAEKAKQLIEMSSSKISVLQEALKQTQNTVVPQEALKQTQNTAAPQEALKQTQNTAAPQEALKQTQNTAVLQEALKQTQNTVVTQEALKQTPNTVVVVGWDQQVYQTCLKETVEQTSNTAVFVALDQQVGQTNLEGTVVDQNSHSLGGDNIFKAGTSSTECDLVPDRCRETSSETSSQDVGSSCPKQLLSDIENVDNLTQKTSLDQSCPRQTVRDVETLSQASSQNVSLSCFKKSSKDGDSLIQESSQNVSLSCFKKSSKDGDSLIQESSFRTDVQSFPVASPEQSLTDVETTSQVSSLRQSSTCIDISSHVLFLKESSMGVDNVEAPSLRGSSVGEDPSQVSSLRQASTDNVFFPVNNFEFPSKDAEVSYQNESLTQKNVEKITQSLEVLPSKNVETLSQATSSLKSSIKIENVESSSANPQFSSDTKNIASSSSLISKNVESFVSISNIPSSPVLESQVSRALDDVSMVCKTETKSSRFKISPCTIDFDNVVTEKRTPTIQKQLSSSSVPADVAASKPNLTQNRSSKKDKESPSSSSLLVGGKGGSGGGNRGGKRSKHHNVPSSSSISPSSNVPSVASPLASSSSLTSSSTKNVVAASKTSSHQKRNVLVVSDDDGTVPSSSAGCEKVPTMKTSSTTTTTNKSQQRQRKKATAKEPIRESLEVGKK